MGASALACLGLLALLYNPDHWVAYPSMDEVRCISTGSRRVYVAVPDGVYILRQSGYEHVRTLTRADGLEGPVRLAVYNPVRPELLVVTDGHLYQYLDVTDRVQELGTPFTMVRSVGIGPDGAYFDTDQGLYRKHRTAAEFTRPDSVPGPVTWFGERDTTDPRAYSFLVPYYVTDGQLVNHALRLVFDDGSSRRVYVAYQDYGVVVFNRHTGFSETHIRMGPSMGRVRRMVLDGSRLLLVGNESYSVLGRSGWSHRRARFGDLGQDGLPFVFSTLQDLDRRENVNALLRRGKLTYAGTDDGLYTLGAGGRPTRLFATRYPVNALGTYRDSVLIGTDNGLFATDSKDVFEIRDPFDRTGFGVYSIARTTAGQTFIGVFGGILSLDADGAWEHIIPPGFELDRPVRALAAGDSVVFFRSASGVTAYDQRFRAYTDLDLAAGLPDDDVLDLYADDNYLWVVSPKMVARFDYKTGLR